MIYTWKSRLLLFLTALGLTIWSAHAGGNEVRTAIFAFLTGSYLEQFGFSIAKLRRLVDIVKVENEISGDLSPDDEPDKATLSRRLEECRKVLKKLDDLVPRYYEYKGDDQKFGKLKFYDWEPVSKIWKEAREVLKR